MGGGDVLKEKEIEPNVSVLEREVAEEAQGHDDGDQKGEVIIGEGAKPSPDPEKLDLGETKPLFLVPKLDQDRSDQEAAEDKKHFNANVTHVVHGNVCPSLGHDELGRMRLHYEQYGDSTQEVETEDALFQ